MRNRKAARREPETLEKTYALDTESTKRAKARNRVFKITGAALAGTALAGMSFSACFAAESSSVSSSTNAGTTSASSKINVNSSLAYSQAGVPSEKNETVYVFSKADGTVKNVTVSGELKNDDKSTLLRDPSNLTNVVNAESKGEFAQTGEGYVWDAEGESVYYQGQSSSALPVEVKVTYTLDGVKVQPGDLAGKNGHVKIRFDYTNLSKQSGSVYTPFVALTGLIMDNENFKNVKVTNGKAIDDGDRTIVAGYAMLGLEEDLGISVGSVDIPDYVEIEADASNFKLDSTLTMVSSSFFNDVNTDFDSGDIQGSIDALNSASNQLVDGSSQLVTGLNQLNTGATALAAGTTQLADATSDLPAQTTKLNVGAGQLASGLSQAAALSAGAPSGAQQLYAGSAQLGEGLTKLDGVLGTTGGYIDDALTDLNGTEIEKDMQSVSSAADAYQTAYVAAAQAGYGEKIASTHEALTPLFAQLKENAALLKKISDDEKLAAASAQASAATAQSDVSQAEESLSAMSTDGMTEEQKDAIAAAQKSLSSASGNIENATASVNEVASLSDDITTAASNAETASNSVGDAQNELQAQDTETSNALTEYQAAAANLQTAATLLQTDAAKANVSQAVINMEAAKGFLSAARGSQGLGALCAGNTQITTNLGTLSAGITKIAAGLGSASDGATQLAAGTQQLAGATPTLVGGIAQVNTGAQALASGATSASAGTQKLADGMKQFNDEGIQKIVSMYQDNIAGLGDRVKATAQAGKDYNTFSGIEQGTTGQVKFVFETDAIEAGK